MNKKLTPNCGKCGLCLNVCPVYKVLKEEQTSPRAKLQLIKAYDNSRLVPSPLLKEIVSKCLMCGACAANCPSGIDHYSQFMEMRQKMAAAQGESSAIKSLVYLLAREYRLKFGAGLARTGQRLVPEKFAATHKLGNIPLKNFPKLNPVPVRKIYDEVILPDRTPVGTVAYFTGCATNYLYKDTGIAVIETLRHMGYKIIIPKGQTCCAIPLLFHGAKDMALENIHANINALKNLEVDAVLVDCTTCGEALKTEYPRLIEGQDPENSHARAIAAKVTDILSFIHSHFDRLEFDPGFTEERPITYHEPCHSRNGRTSNIRAESLLQSLEFVTYQRADDAEECCGGGGTFFYEFPEISKKMVAKKIETVRKLATGLWLTDCPVCRMNLAGNLADTDNLSVLHPITLIHSALKQI